MSRVVLSPSAFAMLTMYSVGVLMSARYADGAVNSGLMNTSRMSCFTEWPDLRNAVARRVTYASSGIGVTKWVRILRTTNGAVAGCATILSSTRSVFQTFVSPRYAYGGP